MSTMDKFLRNKLITDTFLRLMKESADVPSEFRTHLANIDYNSPGIY